MTTLQFSVPACWPLQRPFPTREIPEITCLGVDDVSASEVKAGGRVVIVTPYDPDDEGDTRKICSGQYGQWQVLTGLGGQIHRGLFVGETFKKNNSTTWAPGVVSVVDTGDCCLPGERALAVRDRGRWYITKLGGGGASGPGNITALVIGGNASYADTEDLTLSAGYSDARTLLYKLKPDGTYAAKRMPPPVSKWAAFAVPKTWDVDNQLPRLPHGLCYVQLERPHKFQGKSWEAGLAKEYDEDLEKPLSLYAVTVSPTSPGTLTIYLTRGAVLATEEIVPAAALDGTPFAVVVTGGPAPAEGEGPLEFTVVFARGQSGLEMTATVSPATEYGHDYIISFAPGLFLYTDATVEPSVGAVSSALSDYIEMDLRAGSIIIATNRWGAANYRRGERVAVSLKTVQLTDEDDITKSLPEVQFLAGQRKTLMLEVIDGNTLGAGVVGIKFVGDDVTVSDFLDPNVVTTFPDGLGRGRLIVDGIYERGYVLIRHLDPRGGGALPSGLLIPAGELVSIPYAAGRSMIAYSARTGRVV